LDLDDSRYENKKKEEKNIPKKTARTQKRKTKNEKRKTKLLDGAGTVLNPPHPIEDSWVWN